MKIIKEYKECLGILVIGILVIFLISGCGKVTKEETQSAERSTEPPEKIAITKNYTVISDFKGARNIVFDQPFVWPYNTQVTIHSILPTQSDYGTIYNDRILIDKDYLLSHIGATINIELMDGVSKDITIPVGLTDHLYINICTTLPVPTDNGKIIYIYSLTDALIPGSISSIIKLSMYGQVKEQYRMYDFNY